MNNAGKTHQFFGEQLSATLEELGKRSGMLGVIFRKAQNKI